MFRRIATIAVVGAVLVTSMALAATPRHASYSGTGVANTGHNAKLKLQADLSKRGRVHVTILKAIDGCFGASAEGSRAEIRNGHFAITFSGGNRAAGFAAQLSGQFSSARSATVKVHTVAWYYPIVGPPFNCEATSTIGINKL